MTAVHEPSMDDILKSIRRIIRSDQEETTQPDLEQKEPEPVPVQIVAKQPAKAVPEEEKPRKQDDDNLIRMKIHDQKRLRILEKKLQTMETEYEQKLLLHRRKMMDFRRQNEDLNATVDAYKSKLEEMSSSLKTAHSCLEQLQVKNKSLKDKILKMARLDEGGAVLKTIQREFTNLYHPDRAKGDDFSRLVRGQVYNEFNEVLKDVRSQVESRRS